jgi:hypothetical protein
LYAEDLIQETKFIPINLIYIISSYAKLQDIGSR